MSINDELITVSAAARLLGVSERRVRQMTGSGDLTLPARGLVDRVSLQRHLATRQGAHTRAWSTETAWAGVALLCGFEVDWLGTAQRSRLRTSLRATTAQALVSRARNRASVHRYAGHASTAARLRTEIAVAGRVGQFGLVGEAGQLDGYVATDSLASLVTRHALTEDSNGHVALRATDFNLATIAAIAEAGSVPVLAALDLAESMDARERGVALDALAGALARFRG